MLRVRFAAGDRGDIVAQEHGFGLGLEGRGAGAICKTQPTGTGKLPAASAPVQLSVSKRGKGGELTIGARGGIGGGSVGNA